MNERHVTTRTTTTPRQLEDRRNVLLYKPKWGQLPLRSRKTRLLIRIQYYLGRSTCQLRRGPQKTSCGVRSPTVRTCAALLGQRQLLQTTGFFVDRRPPLEIVGTIVGGLDHSARYSCMCRILILILSGV